MKVFFILIFFSFMLAMCQGKCYLNPLLPEIKDGKTMWPNTCVDVYDRRKHLIGSTWNTNPDFRCKCLVEGSQCCERHVGVVHRPGCITVVNPETCEYDFYLVEAPSWRC